MDTRKSVLHILPTRADDTQQRLMDALSQYKQATVVHLHDAESTDYESLVDLIFEHDEVITWW